MDFLYLTAMTFIACLTPPYRWRDVIRHIDFIANESVGIVCLCVGFAAMVTIIEASFHMKLVIHNDSMVPGFAAMLILRELGAVVVALLITSRVGAGIAAEVGTMQITEQIDALRMMGIDPIRLIVAPRLIASVISVALLAVIACLFCLAVAMLVSTWKLGYSFGGFISAMHAFVHIQDLVFASIKGASFGVAVPLLSCYYGFRCKAGAEGVGLATTNSVVSTSIAVILIDFILTFIFSHF